MRGRLSHEFDCSALTLGSTMHETLYALPSIAIAGILLVSLVLAVEAGYRIGHRHQVADEWLRTHMGAMQNSLLGILALLLAFTFSLSLQRYDDRSEAVVDETNAIGTVYLRTQLVPVSIRGEVQRLIRDYVNLRVRESTLSLADRHAFELLRSQANGLLTAIWHAAVRAVNEDPRPVTSGLFLQSVNEMIDSLGRRDAEMSRHVPEVVLLLLYATFLITGGVIGYSAGIAARRPALATHLLIAVIVLLVFIIIDVDRPHRGLVQVRDQGLMDLQAQMRREAETGPTSGPGNVDSVRR